VSCPQEIPGSAPASGESPRWVYDSLIGITEIRSIFKLGRTAAYELTHRPGFPGPVPISPRCYRWWASEVAAFTAALSRESDRASAKPPKQPRPLDLAVPPPRITGKLRTARSRKEAS
jgi:predicted DNA-binding transcriptional regulator AlpA